MASDQERGREIAEIARLFYLWLRDNSLPGFEYYKDLEQFDVYAGVYRAYAESPSPSYPRFGDGDTPDNRALKSLGPLRYRLLHTNRIDHGRQPPQTRNMLVAARRTGDLNQEGALLVHEPVLDSVAAAAASDELHETRHFWLIQNRTDMVWDSAAEAKARNFRFAELLDFEPPREAYAQNLNSVLPPAGLLMNLPRNSSAGVIRQRQDRFYDYLYWNATYKVRKAVREKGGDYYTKWSSKFPAEARAREPRPSKMSRDFLERNYKEVVLKQGEKYLLMEDQKNTAVFWLATEPGPAGRKKLSVRTLFFASRTPQAATAENALVVFFHALEGADKQFEFRQGHRSELTSTRLRYTVDYKAVVRNFSGGSPPDLRTDEQWLARFASIMFPEAAVAVNIMRQFPGAPLDREAMFLRDLRAAADAAVEPFRSALKATVSELEKDNTLVLLTQGMLLPQDKRFMGMDRSFNLYEWDAKAGIVTRIAWGDFTSQAGLGSLALRVFENTKGMIPVIKVIVWGGAAVMGGGVLGGGGGAARLLATDWVGSKLTGAAAKKALDRIKPQILATLINAIMSLLPQGDSLARQFFHGFLHGLGAGSIETYIFETDERLQRAFNKVADKATKNAYKVYRYAHRLVSDAHKIASLIQSIYKVWSNQLANALAELLEQFSTRLATGFVILLVLIFYLDFAYVRGAIPKIVTEREWKRMRKKWIGALFTEFRSFFLADAIALRNPPPLQDGMLPHDPAALKQLIKTAKSQGKGSVAEDLLGEVLVTMGIPSWEKIRNLDPWTLLESGFDGYVARNPNIVKEEVFSLGEALGSLAGLLMLERSVLGSDKRKQWTEKMPAYSSEVQTALAEGTPRALLRFLKFPLERVLVRVKQLSSGASTPATQPARFTKTANRKRFGLEALRAIVREELRDLSAMLIALAADQDLEAELIATMNGPADQDFPSLDELAGSEAVPGRKAMLFALAHCLRLALSEIDQAFRLLEDDQKLGGHLTLGKLLDVFRLEEDSVQNVEVFR